MEGYEGGEQREKWGDKVGVLIDNNMELSLVCTCTFSVVLISPLTPPKLPQFLLWLAKIGAGEGGLPNYLMACSTSSTFT